MHFLSKLSLMILFTTSTGTFSPSCVSIKFTSVYDCGGKGGRGTIRLFPGLLCQLFSVVDNSATGDKIVETLYSNGVTSENKRICTAPLSPPFKVGVFVVFHRKLEHRHNIAWRGWGRKSYISPF